MLPIQNPGAGDLAHLMAPDRAPFRVLIVDDDADILASTHLALRNARAELDGREIVVEGAGSETEARERLTATPYALALIDVVMEQPDSGLKLLKWIRDTQADRMMRLALRTGNPGSASELSVLRAYDLSDYRSKSLAASQVATLVKGQVRNYRDVIVHARQAWLHGRLAVAMHSVASGMRPIDALRALAIETFALRAGAGADTITCAWLEAADAAAASAAGGCVETPDGTAWHIAGSAAGVRLAGLVPSNAAAASLLAAAAEALAAMPHAA